MTKLNDSEIAGFASSAGVKGNNVAIATAIAIAESQGNPNAHNAIPPDNSYGLWQINMLGAMGPSRRRQFGISKNEDLYNPRTNAKAMYQLSNGGTNFNAWTTFTTKKYLLYMSRGNSAAGTPGGSSNPNPNANKGPVPGLAGLSDLGSKLTDSNTWWKLGMNTAGFLLILIGILILSGAGSLVTSKAQLAAKVLK